MTQPSTLTDVSTPTVDNHGVLLLAPEEETVAENPLHEGLVSWLVTGLKARYADRPDVAVHGRIAWFPDRSDTHIRLDPDVMVVFGRPKNGRSSYRAWNEDDIAPTVLIEVLSRNDTAADYDTRLTRARIYGAAEIILVDPFGHGGVRVDHLLPDPDRPDAFHTVATSINADTPVHIATLGISLAGGPTLIVTDEHGAWPDTPDAFTQARTQRTRAETAEAQAEAARAQAEAAAAQVAAMAALLQAHGIDPDQP